MDFEKEILALKEKVDNAPPRKNKLTLVVLSGDLDKQLAAMIIATGAAASGMEVSMFYTFWGTPALRDPKKKARGKDFMSAMFGMMLNKGWNKTKLSKLNMAGMGSAMIKGLMKKKNVASLDQMYDIAAQLGVRITICEMTMSLMGFKVEEMIDYPHLRVGGVAAMLEDARESAIQFFI